MSSQRFPALLLIVFLLSSGTTYSQTVWTAGIDDWNTPGNWTLGVPNAASGTAFDAIIANAGTAQLTVPGGSVRRLRVGLAGGTGNLIVDGGTLNVTDDLHLNEGSAGPATMTVQNGAAVTAVDTVVGFNSAANTSFTISGAGTTYNATNDFTVGRLGTGFGTLIVDQGAVLTSVTSGIAPLGGAGLSNGTVTGAGSRWSTTGAFTVGSSVLGALNITDQGTVHVGTALNINGTSNVNLNGGTLRFDTIGGTGGVSRINYTSGTIQTTNIGFPNPLITALFGVSPTIPAGKTLVVESSGFFFSGGSIGVTGGDLRLGSIASFTGSVLGVTAGNVSIESDLLVNTGLISVSGPSSLVQIAGSLTIQTSANFGTPDATLNVSNGASVFIDGNLTIDHPGFNFPPRASVNLSGGTLRFDGYTRIGNDTGAQFNYTGGTIQLANDRNIGVDATISTLFGANPQITTGKGLTVEGTATLTTSNMTLAGGILSAGTLAMMPGSRLKLTQASQAIGPVVALPGSLIDATGGDLTIGDATKVNGYYGNGTLLVGQRTVILADANDAVLDSAALVTLGNGAIPGTLNADNGLTLDFGGNITGFGTVSTPNMLSKPLINNGHIAGNNPAEQITLPGYVKGVGTFDNVNITGTFSPGLSPTILSVGSMDFSPSSTLIMELGGTTPGSGYDQLLSSSTLALDGTLQISLINGFSPTSGQSFDLLMAPNIIGAFESVVLPPLPGFTWNTSQLSTGVLSVALPGDFDFEGDVDGRDFLVWQRGGSPNGTGSDDLALWQAKYGSTLPLIGNANAVPEPASHLLFSFAIASYLILPRAQLRKMLILPGK